MLVKLCRRALSRGANGCRTTAAMVLSVDPNEAATEMDLSESRILLLLVPMHDASPIRGTASVAQSIFSGLNLGRGRV